MVDLLMKMLERETIVERKELLDGQKLHLKEQKHNFLSVDCLEQVC